MRCTGSRSFPSCSIVLGVGARANEPLGPHQSASLGSGSSIRAHCLICHSNSNIGSILRARPFLIRRGRSIESSKSFEDSLFFVREGQVENRTKMDCPTVKSTVSSSPALLPFTKYETHHMKKSNEEEDRRMPCERATYREGGRQGTSIWNISDPKSNTSDLRQSRSTQASPTVAMQPPRGAVSAIPTTNAARTPSPNLL